MSQIQREPDNNGHDYGRRRPDSEHPSSLDLRIESKLVEQFVHIREPVIRRSAQPPFDGRRDLAGNLVPGRGLFELADLEPRQVLGDGRGIAERVATEQRHEENPGPQVDGLVPGT